jgi:flagellar hook assembly protein FlgD
MQVRNNPMLTGRANVHFGLAKADKVTARVFDVTGRLVRTLADRNFPAGEHDLYWDGADDGGRHLERGVYFTQLKYAKTGFVDARKVTVLR